MLKFLVDHNVPKSVSIFLRREGHDVVLVKEIEAEMADAAIIRMAVQEDRILISNDKDFIVLSTMSKDANVILFNFIDQGAEVRIKALKGILKHLYQPFGVIILGHELK